MGETVLQLQAQAASFVFLVFYFSLKKSNTTGV
jgi:hypothetical protein